MENLKVKDNTNGKTTASIQASLKLVSNTAKESGKRESMIRTETCMRAAMRMTKKMELDFLPGSLEISTKGVIRTMRGMDMARCTGKMAVLTKESGSMEFKMVSAGWSSQMAE